MQRAHTSNTWYYINTLKKFHQSFCPAFSALRVFCNIKLRAFDTTTFIGYIALECIVINVYISRKSIQYRAVIWRDLIARRHGLADAHCWMHWWMQRRDVQRFAPLPEIRDECIFESTRKASFRCAFWKRMYPRKINYLLRSSDFASRCIRKRARAPDACHNATRASHVECSETRTLNQGDRPVGILEIRERHRPTLHNVI